ncbi:hypothetical protein G3I18_24965 [Actinospica acidiphila]|uniref:Lipoprotein n=1 Tax=Actinospica acidiphila TaxID=304899 RepID=A0A9X5CQK1_9ACTN|nr:hypothetical protein [Actinospica acidiphila]NEC51788.1 hypothetical protein [Actinospica acidiphila]
MKRRTLPTAAAFATAAALLLTACGGGDGTTGSDEIAGVGRQSEQPSKSAEPAQPQGDKPDGVDVSLPADMNLVFDWDKPEDKNEAAAMDDAANFFRAIYRGVDKRTAKEAAITTYSTGEGLHYAETQVNAWIDGGWTATGTLRHYNATTRSAGSGTSVEVAFCADAGKFFGKEVKNGKVLTTKPSLEDFDYYKIIMVKLPTSDTLWQASKVFVETKAAKCQ